MGGFGEVTARNELSPNIANQLGGGKGRQRFLENEEVKEDEGARLEEVRKSDPRMSEK